MVTFHSSKDICCCASKPGNDSVDLTFLINESINATIDRSCSKNLLKFLTR